MLRMNFVRRKLLEKKKKTKVGVGGLFEVDGMRHGGNHLKKCGEVVGLEADSRGNLLRW